MRAAWWFLGLCFWAAVGAMSVGVVWDEPCWAADLYGGGSDLPEDIRTLLAAKDPASRKKGMDKLAAWPRRQGIPHLVQRLGDEESSLRAYAATMLGPFPTPLALPRLMSLLSDPDSQVRAACAEAVGQFGAMDPASKERAKTQLTRAMGDAEPLVRQESVRALERLVAAGILSLSDVPHLLSPLLLRAEDENVSVRKISMRFLGRLSDQTLPKDVRDRVLLALLGRLSDPARDVRAEAVRSLGLLGLPVGVPAALRMLKDPSEDVRKQALLCLGRLADETALPIFRETLETGNDNLRSAALRGLALLVTGSGKLSDAAFAQGMELLLQKAETHRPLMMDAFSKAGPRVGEWLCAELSSSTLSLPEKVVRIELLRDLHATLPEDKRLLAERSLLREFSANHVPKEFLLDALGVLGGRETTVLLASLLRDKEAPVRRKAAMFLRRPAFSDVRAARALRQAATDADSVVKHHALGALGNLGQGEDLMLLLLEGNGVGNAPGNAMATGRTPDQLETMLVTVQAMKKLADSGKLSVQGASRLREILRTPNQDGARVRRACAEALVAFAATHKEQENELIADALSVLRNPPDVGGPHREVLLLLSGLLRGKQSETVQNKLLSLALMSAESGPLEQALAVDALSALHAFVDGSAQSRLIKLTAHKDPLRALRATGALGVLLSKAPTETTVAALFGPLQQRKDPRLAAEAAFALSNLPRNHPLAGSVVEQLRAALVLFRDNTEDHAAVRCNLLAALARLGHALPTDLYWLDDADSGVRANAALLAAHLVPRNEAIEVRLRNVAQSDDDKRVRNNAKAALLGQGAHGLSTRKHWLVTYQTDIDGLPRAWAPYRLLLADGLVRAGYADRSGATIDELLPDGNCEVELPSSSREET